MSKRGWLGAVLCCFVLFSAFGMKTEAGEREEAVVPKGVFLDDVDVSGMNEEQAKEALEEYVEFLAGRTLTLQVEEHQVPVPMREFGLKCANPEVVRDALGVGRSGDIIKRFKEMKELKKTEKELELKWTVNDVMVGDVVDRECVQFDVAAKDAGLTRENGGFTIIPGTTGVKLNVEGSKAAIKEYVENDWDKEDCSVALPAEIEQPKGSAEELGKVKDVLGTFTTSYSSSGANRSKNVANGCRLINGTVLYPGDTFSTYDTIKPFSTANGYELAGSYLNGKVVESLGGGICQVSTTLYNAVLRSELEVKERHNHSMIVGYVDPSADAAISESSGKDFKFVNNTDAPIYIEGSTSGDKKITFTIYGQEYRASGHSVKYVSQTLSTQEPGVQIVADGGQPIGYYHAESSHRGVVAELYKHTYENGQEVKVEKVNKSTYKASPRMVYVGVAGDPELSAQLQGAIATQDEGTVKAVMASCVAAAAPPAE